MLLSDAQKIMEQRQRRIDAAHRALQQLRLACVVWPNPAKEVLLAGSFDGWASQVSSFLGASGDGLFS